MAHERDSRLAPRLLDLPPDASRESLENSLIDVEAYAEDLRLQIRDLMAQHREACANVRLLRGWIDYVDFIEAVGETFGPEIAAVVRNHAPAA